MTYHRGRMMAILHNRVQIAKAVNATVIGLDDAPRGYAESTRAPRGSTSSTRTG